MLGLEAPSETPEYYRVRGGSGFAAPRLRRDKSKNHYHSATVTEGCVNDRTKLTLDAWHLIAAAILALVTMQSSASAQELIPAAYTPAPVGINVVTLAGMFNSGDLAFDPSGPIDDASAQIFTYSLGYARTLSVAGRSATFGIVLPYLMGDLEGRYLGEFASVYRSGIGDTSVRFAVNLLGAPAMTRAEFKTYRPRTLIGTTLVVQAPTGQYDPLKLINIGTNRWAFEGQVGIVQVMGRWAVDFYVAGKFFTDNTDFGGGLTREQEPVASAQAHLRRAFSRKTWAAIDANYWFGGQSTVNGVTNDDEQSNSRVGLTVSTRVGPKHTLRIAYSRGAITRIGGDFDSIGVSFSYSWARKR